MGSISSTIKKPAKEEHKQASLELDLLTKLSESKLIELENKIESLLRTAGEKENLTLKPISKIAMAKQVLARTSEGTSDAFFESIKNIAGDFISGGSKNIVSGISKGIQTLLKTIVGQSSGAEKTVEYYSIVTEGYSILRLDVAIWTKNVKAEQLTVKKEIDLFAFYGTKTTVDINNLEFNTFLALYQQVVCKAPQSDDPDKYLQNYKSDLKNAYHVFHTLKNPKESFMKDKISLKHDPINNMIPNTNKLIKGNVLNNYTNTHTASDLYIKTLHKYLELESVEQNEKNESSESSVMGDNEDAS